MFRHFASLMLSAAFVFAVFSATQAEERIHHYAVETPKTTAEALDIITKKVSEIEAFEKQGKMESIHEQTYHLEAAVDELRKTHFKDTKSLDALDEAVQTTHFASENGKAAEVKAELPKLKAAAALVTGKK